jgi:hypothetical protein
MQHNEVTGVICSKIKCVLLNERHVKKAKTVRHRAKAANIKRQTVRVN